MRNVTITTHVTGGTVTHHILVPTPKPDEAVSTQISQITSATDIPDDIGDYRVVQIFSDTRTVGGSC